MNTSVKLPAKRRKISTPAERLERAEKAVEKAHAYAVKMADKAKRTEAKAARARDSQQKALGSLLAKTLRADKQKVTASARQRALDTRRKIIAGALALEHMAFDGGWALVLKKLIDEYVTRDQDRVLFDLPPLPGDDPRRGNPKVY